jgi:hypothetical protein
MIAPQEMQQRLAQVFNERQAVVLADVIKPAYSDLVRTSGFNESKEIVRELAAAQQRTEQALKKLIKVVNVMQPRRLMPSPVPSLSCATVAARGGRKRSPLPR